MKFNQFGIILESWKIYLRVKDGNYNYFKDTLNFIAHKNVKIIFLGIVLYSRHVYVHN